MESVSSAHEAANHFIRERMLSRFLPTRRMTLYPIDGTAELAIAARGAENQLVSRHMLAQFVLAAHGATPDWRDSVTCYRRPRS